MGSLTSILKQLDERYIARTIGIRHDEARMTYYLSSNTVADMDKFRQVIGDYYNHHFTTCISRGGTLNTFEAQERAKEIIGRDYKSRGSSFIGAYNDAHDGTNGGLRIVLDTIANRLKEESVERHIRNVFDNEVRPNKWEDKVDIIRQFIAQCGPDLAGSIDVSKPEKYASNYDVIIRAYMDSLKRTSAMFRRL